MDRLREGTVSISFLQALTSPDLVQRLAARRITSFGMEGIPRISRAQKMDALSSQANIAGYKAVLIAAESLAKFFPMLMTAAGTVFAARVLVIGRRRRRAAGDRHRAAARRAGVGLRRAARVKEQVESLGAKFLELDLGIADAEDKGGYAKALSAERAAGSRSCSPRRRRTSTSSSPPRWCRAGPRRAWSPRRRSRACGPGSVIVDLAAEAGGNCELTEPDEVVVAARRHHPRPDQPARHDAGAREPALRAQRDRAAAASSSRTARSRSTSRTSSSSGACVTHDGEVVHEAVKAALAARKTA